MTDEDERVLEKAITDFFYYTSILHVRPTAHEVHAAAKCAELVMPQVGNVKDNYVLYNPLLTGSAAELDIDPMLPAIGDVDIMYYRSTLLAIPQGHPPPTQLPEEFHDNVKVSLCEIIDSHLPGYVYLELRYLLTKCTGSGRYNAKEYEQHKRIKITNPTHFHNLERHGPAYTMNQAQRGHISSDLVYCVYCLSWLPQAGDWPTRRRNYDWPDLATVDSVVNNGCDMVQVAHRLCKEDEWMSKYQWRLSFSRAEIALLNSWLPEQQIVYHMLRVFMKSDRLTETANDSEVSALSNYHIKTLMLWACELKPRSWWTGDFTVIRNSVVLLQTLAGWLSERRCSHYFINNCNLVDESFPLDTLASRLLWIKRDWLSQWFLNNYIRRFVPMCPESVSRLFDDVSSSSKLERAIMKVAFWKCNKFEADSWCAANKYEYFVM